MKHLLLIIIPTAFAIGLVGVIIWFNITARAVNDQFSVTFVTPRQAVIFWKTPQPAIGYIRYGTSKFRRDAVLYQTSSEPGETHAVFIEEVPLDGLYVSLHTTGESRLLFPKVRKIVYDISTQNDDLEQGNTQ